MSEVEIYIFKTKAGLEMTTKYETFYDCANNKIARFRHSTKHKSLFITTTTMHTRTGLSSLQNEIYIFTSRIQ